MKGASILDADMATVGVWLRNGWRWWLGELAEMTPPALRRMGERQGPLAFYRGEGAIEMARGTAGLPGAPRPADIALPPSCMLTREIGVPSMSAADLRSYVRLEAERLLPLPDAALLIDAAVVSGDSGDGMMLVRVAAVRRDYVEEAVSAAGLAGIVPKRIGIATGAEEVAGIAFDFAPQLRAEGLIAEHERQRLFWWGLVAIAFLVNLGLIVWRDQHSVTRLEEAVAAQQPGVGVYRAIAGRNARIEQVAASTIARRRRHDALGDLGAVSAALPDTAWVQSYSWDGRTLRLAGYLRPPLDIVATLGRSPRLANVRMSNSDVQAGILIGQPFDVSADLRGPRR